MAVEVPIRPARQQEAAALSELCVRSKEVWGYDAAFMALARAALEVKPEEIAAGNVWVAEADGIVAAGVVALAATDRPDILDLAKLFVMPGRLRSGVGLDFMRRMAALGSATRRRMRYPDADCRSTRCLSDCGDPMILSS